MLSTNGRIEVCPTHACDGHSVAEILLYSADFLVHAIQCRLFSPVLLFEFSKKGRNTNSQRHADERLDLACANSPTVIDCDLPKRDLQPFIVK